MFDVLVYLYETYYRPDACPDSEALVKKLSAVGFERKRFPRHSAGLPIWRRQPTSFPVSILSKPLHLPVFAFMQIVNWMYWVRLR
jgi:uncharacterized protein Smg (DUF494 family)